MRSDRSSSQWYVADVVIEIRAEGEIRSRVWVNTLLIRAHSAEEAFSKAERCGRDTDESYENLDGKRVDMIFRGLGDLRLMCGSPRDGEEVCYTEYDDLTQDEVQDLVTPKEKLTLFDPVEPLPEQDPRYRPKQFGPIENDSPIES